MSEGRELRSSHSKDSLDMHGQATKDLDEGNELKVEKSGDRENTDPKPPKIDINLIKQGLREVITRKGKELLNMFGERESLDQSLEKYVKDGETMANELVAMGCGSEVATALTVLTLYDVAILIDDSDSMVTEEGGKRKDTLVQYIDSITEIYKLANPTGIRGIRFLNAHPGKRDWAEESSKTYLESHHYRGVTRIGTELKAKILDQFIYKKDRSGNQIDQIKPLLVLIVTDGAVEGEKKGRLKSVIQDCVNERHENGKGFGAVTFQFSRIGNDLGAAQLLAELDNDTELGDFIDTLPVEIDLGRQIGEDKWFVLPKILLGAILPDWDAQDDYKQRKQENFLGGREGVDEEEEDWAT